MDTQLLIKVARPHLVRAGIAACLALAGFVIAGEGNLCLRRVDRVVRKVCDGGLVGDRGLAILGGALLLAGGIMAVKAASSAKRKASAARMGESRGADL